MRGLWFSPHDNDPSGAASFLAREFVWGTYRQAAPRVLLHRPSSPFPPQKPVKWGSIDLCRRLSSPKRPDESGQFPRHGDGGDPLRFSSSDQLHELPVEAQFGLPGGFDHLGWLSLAPDEDGLGCSRGESLVMPRRFDQDAPDVGVPGLRDASAPFSPSARALSGHHPDERHQLPGRPEAVEVDDFGDNRHGGDGVHAAQCAQSGDGFSHFRASGLLDDLLFDASDAFDFLLDGDDVFAEDGLGVAIREGLRTDPVPVPRRPAFPLGVAPPLAQEELGEPVPPAQQVLPGILAGPQEIAQRFLRGGGDEDGGQFSQAVTPGEFLGVLAVGLDAVPGFSGDEGGCGDVAFDAPVLEEPAQFVPARPGLVDAADRGVLCEPSGQSFASFGGVGKLGAEENRVGTVSERGEDDVFRVYIHPDPGDRILHDRSLLYCGSGRAHPRLTHVLHDGTGQPIMS